MAEAGLDIGALIQQFMPFIVLGIFIIAILAIAGIVAFMVIMARKNNWIVYPWEWKWNILVWQPSGEDWVYRIDKGALIDDKGKKKIKLKSMGFALSLPPRKLIHPNMQIEGFSTSYGMFIPTERTFVGYNKMPSPGTIKELETIMAALEKKELSEKERTRLESMKLQKTNEINEQMGFMETAYTPSYDVNAHNMMLSEGEKINLQFPKGSDLITQLVVMAFAFLVVLVTLMIWAQMAGDSNKSMQAQAESNKETAMAVSKLADILNASYQMRNVPVPVPGGG